MLLRINIFTSVMACFFVLMVFPQIKEAPRNKGNGKKHEHHHRGNCHKSCTFVMFLHGVSYQSFSPFQVLNFYFDMERTNERGRSSSSRETLGRLGLFNCEEYFKYFYKGRQLIDRRLLCKEILYILNVSFPPSYIYKGSLPLTSKLENMKYLQVNV